MGLISKLLSFTRVIRGDIKASEAKVNPGGEANLTCDHFAGSGDDSFPLPDDGVALMTAPRSGSAIAIGYADTKNTPVAVAGEKRIYARDSSGAVVCEAHLKNDGTVHIFNSSGSFEMAPSGDIVINGTTFSPNGDVTTSGNVSGGGIDLVTHTHGGVTTGSGSTGVAQ